MELDCSKIIFTANPKECEISEPELTELVRNDLERIGIDEIRWLTAEAHRRPKEGYTEKLIVMSGSTITSEAQQASLKIIEEPPIGSHIIIIFPTGTQLLPTVLSRVQTETQERKDNPDVFTAWLELGIAERIATVDTKAKAKDIPWMQGIKTGLQQHVAEEQNLTTAQKKELLLVINHLLTRGASNKMLLEQAALQLPLTD